MNKEFTPYEQALELKELGFDGPCLGFYRVFSDGDIELLVNSNSDMRQLEAPTFSQAFRWFREKHDLHSYIEMYRDDNSHYFDYVTVSDIIESVDYEDGPFKTYEEAELACLNKLIEIVKNKKD